MNRRVRKEAARQSDEYYRHLRNRFLRSIGRGGHLTRRELKKLNVRITIAMWHARRDVERKGKQ